MKWETLDSETSMLFLKYEKYKYYIISMWYTFFTITNSLYAFYLYCVVTRYLAVLSANSHAHFPIIFYPSF